MSFSTNSGPRKEIWVSDDAKLTNSKVLTVDKWVSYHFKESEMDIVCKEWPRIVLTHAYIVYVAPWGEYFYRWENDIK